MSDTGPGAPRTTQSNNSFDQEIRFIPTAFHSSIVGAYERGLLALIKLGFVIDSVAEIGGGAGLLVVCHHSGEKEF